LLPLFPPQLEELSLQDIALAPRMLSYLQHLPRLSSLTLASKSSLRGRRVNGDGCVSELRYCSALRRWVLAHALVNP